MAVDVEKQERDGYCYDCPVELCDGNVEDCPLLKKAKDKEKENN